ncbi:hypothetical protein TL18_03830 [Methanobrevibacter sp. YE315]|uniref:hypothetical protein n=1 Tax=Methanobrevibacter sp. YE315 TaxID=1609968 RepID=UPI000764E559|nr:hypothetical protein [Methanobrevibacter sp. YE315]AMD17227.1 hypothetical protein TL18_03830 [Methanobrevibacter sp. YE315]
MDKETIKKELVDESNNILAKYAEPDIVESVSVMNMSAKTVFLGSLRVYNEDVVSDIVKDLEKQLKGYGELSVRDEKIIPCCAPNYTHISFNITIKN